MGGGKQGSVLEGNIGYGEELNVGMTSRPKYYSRQGLWSLFLMCAFPLHVWALILFFNDYGWIAKRTNAWDAIGAGSYGLVFTFFESTLVFLGAVLLGFFISTKWEENRRLALMSVMVFITSLWAMIGQLYFLSHLSVSLPMPLALFLLRSGHPVRYLNLLTAMIIGLTVLLPALFILKSQKTLRFVMGSIERISLLTTFYLFFDLLGLIIVIIRNVA